MPRCIRQEVSLCAEHKKPRRLMKLLEKIRKGGGGGGGGGSSNDSAGGHTTAQADTEDPITTSITSSSSFSSSSSSSLRDRRVLIFANKIKAVSFIATLLNRHGFPCSTLSSRAPRNANEETTLRQFGRGGSVQILVATDVAARGVHIDGLRHVVNWDFGTNLAQYVHRIGRTGRQGQPGTAYSFFSRQLRPLAPAAVRLLQAHDQPVDQYLASLAKEVEAESVDAGEAPSGRPRPGLGWRREEWRGRGKDEGHEWLIAQAFGGRGCGKRKAGS